MATARAGSGPGLAGTTNEAGRTIGSEGPTAVKIGDDYLLYFDAYVKKHYGALRSRDLKTWEDVTAKMSFPDEDSPVRMRHGTIIAVPVEIVTKLRAPAVP